MLDKIIPLKKFSDLAWCKLNFQFFVISEQFFFYHFIQVKFVLKINLTVKYWQIGSLEKNKKFYQEQKKSIILISQK